MTLFYKIVTNGYIDGFGTNGNNNVIEITEAEFNMLLNIIHNRPIPPEGFDYILKADTLTWELTELPEPEPTIEDEAEAYNILIGNTP